MPVNRALLAALFTVALATTASAAPPTKEELRALLRAMGQPVRSILREKGAPYGELGLADPKWTDDQLLDFIVQHPILLQRPIVVTPLATKLCRPSEEVLEILPR